MMLKCKKQLLVHATEKDVTMEIIQASLMRKQLDVWDVLCQFGQLKDWQSFTIVRHVIS